MIEKYFQKGIRFRWRKPNDSTGHGESDGSIVESNQGATPMNYDGVDDVLITNLNMHNLRALGLTKNRAIQYAWLDYAPGHTARKPIGPYDVLTGYMSGCIICHWHEKGVNYTGHIGTIDSSADVNRKVKRTFSFAMNKTCKGFNPLAAWPTGEIMRLGAKVPPSIFGLVTTGGLFFSIVMFPRPNQEWVVGGIKACAPISHDTLKLQLLR